MKATSRYKRTEYGLILILFWVGCLVVQAVFAEEEWKIIGLSSKGTLFYNPETMAELSAEKRGVWTKFVCNAEGLRWLQSRGSKFAGAAYLTNYYEINCLERITRCRSAYAYSRKGDSLGPLDCSSEGAEAAMIFPKSFPAEFFLQKFCP